MGILAVSTKICGCITDIQPTIPTPKGKLFRVEPLHQLNFRPKFQTSNGSMHAPHRLARYFDDLKSPMCCHCRKWGNLGMDCPENVVYSVGEVFNDNAT